MKLLVHLIRRAALALVLLFALSPLIASATRAQEEEKVSRPGKYSGYSQPVYSEWVRTSQYVAVRDGTRLAVDIFRPAQNGKPSGDPLPVIWSLNRYHRADILDGQLKTILDSEPWLKTLLQHGYVVAVADVRGGGASFGMRTDPNSMQDAQDAYDLTEWFAAQPWCDGKVGMFGASFMGSVQLMAASLASPHLKAIVPQVAPFDRYAEYYPGGVFMDQAAAEWSRRVRDLDTVSLAAPVDEDRDGALLAKAVAEHQANQDFYSLAASLPYRDSAAGIGGTRSQPWLGWGASNYVSKIEQSGVAIYHMAGWYDYYRRGALISFANLSNPQKVLIGPWTHDRYGEYFDLGAEHLRWYDYWLKGIDNGIMAEPPIYYYALGLPEKTAWRFVGKWPLPTEQLARYYFRAGRSKSVNSVNDGVLSTEIPTDLTAQDKYTVDYATTTNESTSWNDQRGLTYTTLPLPANVEVTGHPVVHLWVSSTAGDADFFVYLEDVSENGASKYLSDGVLRASHRALAEPPFDAMSLPYHRSFAGDVAILPAGEPVELVLDLLPVSNVFHAGHRIRVTITGADQDNASTPVLSPPPEVSLYRDAQHASYIVLPIIPGSNKVASPSTKSTRSLVILVVLITLAVAAGIAVVYIRKLSRQP